MNETPIYNQMIEDHERKFNDELDALYARDIQPERLILEESN